MDITKVYKNNYLNYLLMLLIFQIRYLLNPLLIENKKFDYRAYVVILCAKPFVAYFRHGYLKKSMFDYYNQQQLKNI